MDEGQRRQLPEFPIENQREIYKRWASEAWGEMDGRIITNGAVMLPRADGWTGGGGLIPGLDGVALHSASHPEAGTEPECEFNPESIDVVEVELPEPAELRPPACDTDWKPDHAIISLLHQAVRQRDVQIEALEVTAKVRADAFVALCQSDAEKDARISALEAQNARLLNEVARLESASPRWHSLSERGADGWPALAPNAAAMRQWEKTFGQPIAQHERVTVPIGTLTGDAKVNADRLLAKSVEPVLGFHPRKGEFVTCQAGHLICEVIATAPGAPPEVGEWRVDMSHQNGRCCPCGADYYRPGGQFHIKGRGWV